MEDWKYTFLQGADRIIEWHANRSGISLDLEMSTNGFSDEEIALGKELLRIRADYSFSKYLSKQVVPESIQDAIGIYPNSEDCNNPLIDTYDRRVKNLIHTSYLGSSSIRRVITYMRNIIMNWERHYIEVSEDN